MLPKLIFLQSQKKYNNNLASFLREKLRIDVDISMEILRTENIQTVLEKEQSWRISCLICDASEGKMFASLLAVRSDEGEMM
jgi:hypothetical protein